MGIAMLMLVAVGIWAAVMLLVMSLCRAAKLSDDAMDTALARAVAASREAEITRSPPAQRPLRSLEVDHAAALLGVTPDTLLAWETRYGFPTSNPSERRYNELELLALRESLCNGLSIAAAVARARDRTKRRRTPTAARVADHRGDGLVS